jgi:DNA-binding NarL/FixJ family response regulator
MSPGLSPIRVLTVDDHPLVREGIAGLIGGESSSSSVRQPTALPDTRRHPP